MRSLIIFLLFLNLSYSLTIDEIYNDLSPNNASIIDGLNYYADDYLHDKNTNGYFQRNYYGRSMWVKTDFEISSGVLGFPGDTCGLVVSNVIYVEQLNEYGQTISAGFSSSCSNNFYSKCFYFSKVELFWCSWGSGRNNDNSEKNFLNEEPDIVCKDKEILNPQTGNCVADCSDEYKNKWGYMDGSCIDCSSAKNRHEVFKCYCKAQGSDFIKTGIVELFLPDKPGFFLSSCDNLDLQVWIYDPEYGKPKDDPKKDTNTTTPPNKDNSNKDKPNTDNGSAGNNGGSSGGNSGSTTTTTTPGDNNKGTDYGKDNPNDGKDNPNGNPSGKPDGKECKTGLYDKEGKCLTIGDTDIDINNGENGKGDDGNGDFNGDTSYYESEQEGFFNTFSEHLTTSLKKIDEFNEGLEGFINQVQKGSFTGRSEKIKNSCPKNFSIDVGFRVVNINTDYCKELSSVSEISYYIFYAFFGVVAFAFLFKLMFLSF